MGFLKYLKKRKSKSLISNTFSVIVFVTGFLLSTLFFRRINHCTLHKAFKEKSFFSIVKDDLSINIKPENNFLFVGVMTAQQFLDTRVKAVFETWGKNVPGKIVFFSRAGSVSKNPIPLVELDGVDDSYPPLKKFFIMVKYIYDHYLDDYEWFMRADDDVHIKPERLELFLRALNSSVPYYIGQMGQGSKVDLGLLSIESDENFCMGGSGFIMSKETLRRIGPHLRTCVKNLYSKHDDVEISRCIRDYANISCTWAFDVSIVFI
jgi:chondroitin sulfate synthase